MYQQRPASSYQTVQTSSFGVVEDAAARRLRGADMFTAGRAAVTIEEPMEVVGGVGALASPRALSQKELFQAISHGVVDGVSKLGLLDKHAEVMETLSRQPAVDLTPITRALSQLLTLKDSHSEVLEAITNVTVEQPDLSPILQAIAQLSGPADGHQEMLEAITNIVVDPPDLMPVQQYMEEAKVNLRKTMEDFRNEMRESLGILQQEVLKNRQEMRLIEEFRSEMRENFGVLQQEVLKNRQDTRSNAEVLLQEVQVVPRELEELRKEMRKMDNRLESGQSDLLNAVNQLAATEPDPATVANAVHDRLLRSKLRVDNSDVLQSLKILELDQPALANLITDKIRKTTLTVDSSEVIQAIRRLPEAEMISRTVHDRIAKTLPDKNDHAELLDSVRKIKKEPDLTPIMSALTAAEIDFSPILDAVNRMKLDHTPVLDALRRLEVPDNETIGRILSERLRRHNVVTRDEFGELMGALRRIPDNSEVLEAVRCLERATDLQQVVDGLRSSFPDQNLVAAAILDKIKRTNLHVDTTEVMSAIHGLRLAIAELNRVDMSPVLQEIGKFAPASNQSDVLRAIANVQLDMRQLRENLMQQQQRVVQTVVPQASSVVRGQSCVMPCVMQRAASVPAMVQPTACVMNTQEISSLSPRVVAEIYGPKVQSTACVMNTQEISSLSPRVVAEIHGAKVDLKPQITQTTSPLMPATTKVLPPGFPQVAATPYVGTTAAVSELATEIFVEGDANFTSTFTPRRSPSRSPSAAVSPVTDVGFTSFQEPARDELSASIRMPPPRGYQANKGLRFPGVSHLT